MKTIKNFIKSEDAVSFGYLVIAAFLILGSAIWIEFTPIFNQLFGDYNQNIADGLVTSRNQAAMSFQRSLIYITPIVMLLGVAAWGYIRSLEQRNMP